LLINPRPENNFQVPITLENDLDQIKNFIESKSLRKVLSQSEDLSFTQINKLDYFFRVSNKNVFREFLDTVYKNINRYFDRFLSKERGLQEKNYQDLCKIVEAIERRDSQRAQVLVQDHVRYFSRIMERGEEMARAKDSTGKENTSGNKP